MEDIKSWTGERLETFVYNENTNEHLHRYALAMQLVAGRRVLDIACGEGYGSNLMSAIARTVTGVDIDAGTIKRAKEKYTKPNLHFLEGSTDNIPCEDNSFDIVISFETIEHHDRHQEMMKQIKRVLAPGGVLFISSPDKLYYSDKTGFKNPFHVKELYSHEFEALLQQHFLNTFFMGQRSFTGSMIIPYTVNAATNELAVYQGSYDGIARNGMEAVYIIALASDGALPALNASLLDGTDVLNRKFEAFRLEVTKDAVDNTVREVRSSWSFRIGQFILSPLHVVKKLFHA